MTPLQYHYERQFPNLRPDDYAVTSPAVNTYNCIAWAIANDNLRFWPGEIGYRWPQDLPQEETVDAFIDFFAINGYEVCAGPALEPDCEKIAIYCDEEGMPTHAARQLPSGKWTSKLGDLEDIVHNEVGDIEMGYGSCSYGRATVFMKRQRTA